MLSMFDGLFYDQNTHWVELGDGYVEMPEYYGGTAPAPGVRGGRFPFKTTKHFLNRITQRASRGITPQKAIDAYNRGRIYYSPVTKNYIRHSSQTKVSVVVDKLKGGRAITVFEGNPGPHWVPIKWRP